MLDGSIIPRAVRRIFDQRSEQREPLDRVDATLELRGHAHKVQLANLSPSGAMVILPLMPHIGEQVSLHIDGRGQVSGHVCWVRDGRIGVNFAAAGE
jgi:hypothetical protein